VIFRNALFRFRTGFQGQVNFDERPSSSFLTVPRGRQHRHSCDNALFPGNSKQRKFSGFVSLYVNGFGMDAWMGRSIARMSG
jgi:hypothetical protein